MLPSTLPPPSAPLAAPGKLPYGELEELVSSERTPDFLPWMASWPPLLSIIGYGNHFSFAVAELDVFIGWWGLIVLVAT